MLFFIFQSQRPSIGTLRSKGVTFFAVANSLLLRGDAETVGFGMRASATGKSDGLGDVVIGPELEAIDDILAMASGRNHDDRKLNWRIGLSNRCKSVQTADTGHFDIQQNQIEFGFPDEPLQIVSILGYDDLVAFTCEPAGQHVTIHFIVVNDK